MPTKVDPAGRYQQYCTEGKFQFKPTLYAALEACVIGETFSLSYIGYLPSHYHHRLDDTDAKVIYHCLKYWPEKLRHLDLSHNHLTINGITELAPLLERAVMLKSLNVQHNHIGPEGAHRLLQTLTRREPRQLVYLNLEGCRIRQQGLMLVTRNDILFDGAQSLVGQLLRANPNLAQLNIADNEVEEGGLTELFSQLQFPETCAALRVLDLSGLYTRAFSPDCAYELSRSLTVSPCLERLALSRCSLTDEALVIILKDLLYFRGGRRHHLRVVDFSANQLTHVSCAYLADYFSAQQCALSAVSLSHNLIGDAGAEILAEGLQHNTTLMHWDISRCGIGEAGLGAVCAALEVNTTLQSLRVFWNHFRPANVEQFAVLMSKRNVKFDFGVMIEKEGQQFYELELQVYQDLQVKTRHYTDDKSN